MADKITLPDNPPPLAPIIGAAVEDNKVCILTQQGCREMLEYIAKLKELASLYIALHEL